MSLTTCADCHREVSTVAVVCPHCGRPTGIPSATPAPPAEASLHRRDPMGMCVAIGCLFLLTSIVGGWLLWSGIEAIQTKEDFDAVLGIPVYSKGTEAVVSGWVKCAIGGLVMLPLLLGVIWLILWLCGCRRSPEQPRAEHISAEPGATADGGREADS